jgi:2-C-methyl-D-erythritol 4-phosphate cytidylyltransferase
MWAAIVVAAGRGERFGRPKQFVELAGVPMVGWSMRTFASVPDVAELVVVTEPEWIANVQALAAEVAPGLAVRVVRGGASRQQSVAAGLQAVSSGCTAAFVHDGARPLVRAHDVRAGMREVRAGRAALLATPVVDTVKTVDPATHAVTETLDRSRLWAAQTPQFATLDDLRHAHERAVRDGIDATDDAALLERIGAEVVVVPASGENFKVTLPEDVVRAESVLRARLQRAPV